MKDKNKKKSEVWKKIEGYDNYEVSNKGRVYSLSTNRILIGSCSNGYQRVALRCDKKPKQYSVHRLVVSAFSGPIPSGYDVDHINGIKSDNSLDNLRACTHKENMQNEDTRRKLSRPKRNYTRNER